MLTVKLAPEETTAKLDYYKRKEGGSEFRVITDPRLQFVKHMVEDLGGIYNQEKGRPDEAIFRKGQSDTGFSQLKQMIEDIPLLELTEGIAYARKALEMMPGVEISDQPYSKKKRDGATRPVAVAMDLQTWLAAQRTLNRSLKLDAAEESELRKKLEPLEDDAKEALLVKVVGEDRAEGFWFDDAILIDYNEFSKLDLEKFRDHFNPASEREIRMVVSKIRDHTLTSDNVDHEAVRNAIVAFEAGDEDWESIATETMQSLTRADVNEIAHQSRRVCSPEQRRVLAGIVKAGSASEQLAQKALELDGNFDRVTRWEADSLIRSSHEGSHFEGVEEALSEEELQKERSSWGDAYFETFNIGRANEQKGATGASPARSEAARRGKALSSGMMREILNGEGSGLLPTIGKSARRDPHTAGARGHMHLRFVGDLVSNVLRATGAELVSPEQLPPIFAMETIYASRKAAVGWLDEERTKLVSLENNAITKRGTPSNLWFDEEALTEIDSRSFRDVSAGIQAPAFEGETLVFRKDATKGTFWGAKGRGDTLEQSAFIVLAEAAARDLRVKSPEVVINPGSMKGQVLARRDGHLALRDGNTIGIFSSVMPPRFAEARLFSTYEYTALADEEQTASPAVAQQRNRSAKRR